MSTKADRDYWNSEHRGYRLHIARRKDIIRRWIESHIAPLGDTHASCLEIGCHPGRYLAVFGKLGYQLNGVDFASAVATLPAWLQGCGYRVGSFWQEDFTRFDPRRTFDRVASFGFVEHFTNWEEMLDRHARLVSAGGYLVVEAPNFTGAFQHWLHAGLDQANYARHHIQARDVHKWAELLRRRGFQILCCGCFGRFRFWTEAQPRSLAQRSLLAALRAAQPLLRLVLPPDRPAYSPFCGVIARRA